MRRFEGIAEVTNDGKLSMNVSTGLPPGLHRAIVVIADELAPVGPDRVEGWPAGYFVQTAGILADDPLVRGEQGDYETRDLLR